MRPQRGAEAPMPGTPASGGYNLPAPASALGYTVTELANVAGVRPGTIRAWVSRGVRGVRLASLKVPRGRIPREAVLEFLREVNGGGAADERG